MTRKTIYINKTPLEVYSMVTRGELKRFPNGYLDKEVIKVIVRHLILNVYKYTREEVITKIDHQFFIDNCLGGARKFFEKSEKNILVYSFPEWEIKL